MTLLRAPGQAEGTPAGPGWVPAVDAGAAVVEPTRLRWWQVSIGVAFVLVAAGASVVSGPADLPAWRVLLEVLSRVPLLHIHSGLSSVGAAVVWQWRLPEVVLGALVGGMLAVAGASYQGVFSNPLADPYLLGIAAGAGLGATLAVVEAHGLRQFPIDPLPLFAFVGGAIAVAATFVLSRSATGQRPVASLLLAGVAVAAFFTAVQTFLQDRYIQDFQAIFGWIEGSLATAGWSQVALVAPYILISMAVLVACRRLLDVLSVGDEEATSLGVNPTRTRLIVILAATLGTAAAVSVSGLIGFVGIIIPHSIRLLAGPSYRRIIPLSALFGAGFLIFADLVSRSVISPGEVPIGVITAFVGAPFFLLVLRRSRGLV